MHALALSLLLLAPPERVAVLAVHDPPAPDGELTELTHQLRAASLERVAGVLTAPEMRDRLAGRSGGASLQELDRAFGGALAVYQNGELDSAARTLRAIIDDLEELPEGEAVWAQWTRAMMRLSHVHLSLRQPEEVDALQVALLRIDASHQLDPVLYAPGFRAHFEELRQRVRAMPKRRLTVTARGRPGTIFVSGRDVGPTPATVILPAGTYRVAGAAGALRIPAFQVDLTAEDRAVVLDFALAETFRPAAGPGVVLPPGERGPSIIKAGAWLGVEKLVVASRGSEGGAQFLVGAIYDVRRGALLREGSVRMISGSVPPANLGALAAFLLTGQASREVQDRTREPAAARPSRSAAPPVAASAALPAPAPGPAVAPAAPVTFFPAARAAPAAPPRVAVEPGLARAAAAAGPGAPPAMAALPAPAAPAEPTAPAPEPAAAPARARAEPGPARPGPATPSLPLASAAPRGTAPPAAGAPLPEPAPAPDLRAAPPPEDPVARAITAGPAEGPAEARARARWVRPATIGAGVLAAALVGVAAHQGLAARGAYRDADDMMLPDGRLVAPYTASDHRAALARGDAANRNAWLAGGGALASAGVAALLHWRWPE